MAIVRHNPGRKWVPIGGAVIVSLAVIAWWAQDHGLSPSTGMASRPESSGSSASARPEDEPSAFEALQRKTAAPPEPPATMAAATPEQQKAAQAALMAQAEASRAIDNGEIWKPISGPIKERPPFASIMEWQMLKGVADRQSDPQAELLRMANFLRYTKLLEKWQDLPAGSEPGLRQALARQLVDELPQHVRHGEVDVQDARRQAPAMLRDGYPDGTARSKAEATLQDRLQEAAAAYQASTTH